MQSLLSEASEKWVGLVPRIFSPCEFHITTRNGTKRQLTQPRHHTYFCSLKMYKIDMVSPADWVSILSILSQNTKSCRKTLKFCHLCTRATVKIRSIIMQLLGVPHLYRLRQHFRHRLVRLFKLTFSDDMNTYPYLLAKTAKPKTAICINQGDIQTVLLKKDMSSRILPISITQLVV